MPFEKIGERERYTNVKSAKVYISNLLKKVSDKKSETISVFYSMISDAVAIS